MNGKFDKTDRLEPDELERVAGGQHSIAGPGGNLIRITCKQCQSPFLADPGDPDPQCPFCPKNTDRFT